VRDVGEESKKINVWDLIRVAVERKMSSTRREVNIPRRFLVEG
jgi:hypothetical protein